jgi:hypothetical protein
MLRFIRSMETQQEITRDAWLKNIPLSHSTIIAGSLVIAILAGTGGFIAGMGAKQSLHSRPEPSPIAHALLTPSTPTASHVATQSVPLTSVLPTGLWRSSQSNASSNAYLTPVPFPTPTPLVFYETFKIPELGIQFQIPADLKDLVYVINISNGITEADFSTTTLTNMDTAMGGSDCSASLHAIGAISVSGYLQYDIDGYKHIGNKYYIFSSLQSPYSSNNDVEELEIRQYHELMAAFQTIQFIQ